MIEARHIFIVAGCLFLAGLLVPPLREDAFSAGILGIGGVLTLIFAVLAYRTLKAPEHIWERNRKARLLAKKQNKGGPLSPNEEREYSEFVQAGILTERLVVDRGKNQWRVTTRLSNQATADLFNR